MPDVLEALTRFGQHLREVGLLPDTAFRPATLVGDIMIDSAGRYVGVHMRKRGESARCLLPALPVRSSNVAAAYLSGTPDYWFGGDGRAQRCRAAMVDLHLSVLRGVDHPAAEAIRAFFAHIPIRPNLPAVPGAWGIQVEGAPAHEIPALMEAWRRSYVPDDGNPGLRVIPSMGIGRLTMSSNFPAAKSYATKSDDPQAAQLPPGTVSADYGDALNWLLDRRTTMRLDNTAIVGWVDGYPEIDPTPDFITYDFGHSTPLALPGTYPGDVHFLALTYYPPARVALKLYCVTDGPHAAARIGTFRRRLLHEANFRGNWYSQLMWHNAFQGSPRQAEMVVSILQSVLTGQPVEGGVLTEILRITRRDQYNLGHRVGLLCIYLGTSTFLRPWDASLEVT